MVQKTTITEFVTEDGSITYHNSKFDEHYHTKSGAIEEAFEKHTKPLGIAKVNKKEVSMLDFCFGLGYNALAGLVDAIKNPNIKSIKVVGIEIDPDILAKIKDIKFDYEEWNLIQELAEKKKIIREFKGKQVELILFVADCRDAITYFKDNEFDYVFFDPFSPTKCPELWAPEIFKEMHRIMKKGGILSTYSCARIVKDGLKEANLRREDGPTIGRRSPSTLAFKD